MQNILLIINNNFYKYDLSWFGSEIWCFVTFTLLHILWIEIINKYNYLLIRSAVNIQTVKLHVDVTKQTSVIWLEPHNEQLL